MKEFSLNIDGIYGNELANLKVKSDLSLLEKISVIQFLDEQKELIRNSFKEPSTEQSVMSDFGAYIRKMRLLTKTTMTEMAAFMNISTPELSGLECRRKNITEQHVNKIINFFEAQGVLLCHLHLGALAKKANEEGISDWPMKPGEPNGQ